MTAKKIEIPKDWYDQVDTIAGRRKLKALSERIVLKSLEDVPKWVSAKEAAVALKSNHKTVHDWMAKKILRSIKIRGRRWTTTEWIEDFINKELMRNG
jgi:hypothetical protein